MSLLATRRLGVQAFNIQHREPITKLALKSGLREMKVRFKNTTTLATFPAPGANESVFAGDSNNFANVVNDTNAFMNGLKTQVGKPEDFARFGITEESYYNRSYGSSSSAVYIRRVNAVDNVTATSMNRMFDYTRDYFDRPEWFFVEKVGTSIH